jgi:hypothetical protein
VRRGCKEALRDLKALFPFRGGFRSHVVELRRTRMGRLRDQLNTKVFVLKTKSEGMVGMAARSVWDF